MADRYERGSLGEARTARALDALPSPQWTVLHDVAWPGRSLANIDHVAVGPQGVFVIDSKNWSGAVTLRDGTLRQAGYRRDREVQSIEAAVRAVAVVLSPTGAAVTRGIMCLTGEGRIAGLSGPVAIRPVDELVDFLLTLPPLVHERSVPSIADQLKRGLIAATASRPERVSAPTLGRPVAVHDGPAGQATAAFKPHRSRSGVSTLRSSRARQRRGPSWRADVARLVIGGGIVAVAVTQPSIITKATSGIAEIFISNVTVDDTPVSEVPRPENRKPAKVGEERQAEPRSNSTP
jgi:hypothetical protein